MVDGVEDDLPPYYEDAENSPPHHEEEEKEEEDRGPHRHEATTVSFCVSLTPRAMITTVVTVTTKRFKYDY